MNEETARIADEMDALTPSPPSDLCEAICEEVKIVCDLRERQSGELLSVIRRRFAAHQAKEQFLANQRIKLAGILARTQEQGLVERLKALADVLERRLGMCSRESASMSDQYSAKYLAGLSDGARDAMTDLRSLLAAHKPGPAAGEEPQ